MHVCNKITYLLTPWCRVLLEKLTGLQLVKKFPAFHGTRRFITALTSVRQLSLSRARSIQSMPPHPASWRSILILSSHLCLGYPSYLFPSGFPTKSLYTPILSPKHVYNTIHLIIITFPPICFGAYSSNFREKFLECSNNNTYLLTYSMVQSPSWEANWFAASQEIPCISRNPKVHYRTEVSATCLYLGPAQSSPYTHIPPPGDPS